MLGEFQTLVDPGRAIPPYISVLTGITSMMVAAAPRIGAVLPGVPGVRPRRGPGRAQRAVRPRLPQGGVRRERHRLAGRRIGRHRRPGPPAAQPRRGAQLQAGHAGALLPRHHLPHPPRAGRRPRHRRRAARPLRAARAARHHLARGADRPHPAGRPGAAAQAPPGRRRARAARASTSSAGPRDEPLYVGTSNDLRTPGAQLLLLQRAAQPDHRDGGAVPAGRGDPLRARPRGRRPRAAADRRAQAPVQPPVPVPRAGAVGAAHRGAVPPAVRRPAGAPRRRASSSGRSPTGAPPTRRWRRCTRRCPLRQCTTRISPRVPRHAPARWPTWAAAGPRAPARSRSTSTPPIAAVFRAAVDHDPRAARRAAAGPRRPAGRRGALRGRGACCGTASPSWCGRSAAGSGWSRWPPCPSWCSPGPTAPAAGTCPSSAAAGWSPPGAPQAAARYAATLASLLATAETPSVPDDEAAASVDETELVLRWMEKPGTRLVELTGTLASPAPGTGAFSRFLDRVEARPHRARPLRRRPLPGHPGTARAGHGGCGRRRDASRLGSPA